MNSSREGNKFTNSGDGDTGNSSIKSREYFTLTNQVRRGVSFDRLNRIGRLPTSAFNNGNITILRDRRTVRDVSKYLSMIHEGHYGMSNATITQYSVTRINSSDAMRNAQQNHQSNSGFHPEGQCSVHIVIT